MVHPSLIIQTQTEYRAEHILGPQRAELVAALQAHFPQEPPRVALEEDVEPLPLARLCVDRIPPGQESEVRACVQAFIDREHPDWTILAE